MCQCNFQGHKRYGTYTHGSESLFLKFRNRLLLPTNIYIKCFTVLLKIYILQAFEIIKPNLGMRKLVLRVVKWTNSKWYI